MEVLDRAEEYGACAREEFTVHSCVLYGEVVTIPVTAIGTSEWLVAKKGDILRSMCSFEWFMSIYITCAVVKTPAWK